MATELPPPILQIRGVHAHYGPSHVLHGLSLDVPAGEVTAIVGRNGVGKTTLINAIMGLVPATSGSIRVGGTELVGLPSHRRRGLGLALVPQGRRLFRSLSVDEHLNLVPPVRPGPVDRDWIMARFPRLRERRASLGRTLSGGEQSMLAIARAIILNPTLLLMDEPTEGLAPLLVEEVQGVVSALRETGISLLVVEQKLGFALAVADRVAVMERGVVAHVAPRHAIPDAAALGEMVLGRGTTPTSLSTSE